MAAVALLLAAVLGPVAPPPAIDFGAVELGRAGVRTIHVPAVEVRARGAGFSATRVDDGVLVVFEPYDRDVARGMLRVRTGSRVTRVPVRGRGVDTIAPRLSVVGASLRGASLTVRYAATDNDLVAVCVLAVDGRDVARAGWPGSVLRARVPRPGRAPRVVLTAIDRAGNRGSAPVALRR